VTALEAARRRRSHSKVTAEAPTHEQLLPLVSAAGGVADYGSLQPWRIIELRGDDRAALGRALAAGGGLQGRDAEKVAAKPLRAELLLAIVVCTKRSHKVHDWEQEAAASGVAHLLSLLLDEAGWGVMWRSGPHTRTEPVRRMHRLADDERLLGWLYVGGRPAVSKGGDKKLPDASRLIGPLGGG
jgi:nitroreductase